MAIKENIHVDGKRNIQTKVMTASRLDSKEGEIRHFLELRVSKTAIAKLTSMGRHPALRSAAAPSV